jgi:integrase
VLAGLLRARGRPTRRVLPLLPADLAILCQQLTPDLRGLRDRAILLVGFAAALRRSEVVALDRADITITRAACVLTITRSKTDPHATGERVRIRRQAASLCAVASLEAWLAGRGDHAGPLFNPLSKSGRVLRRRLCDRTVARLIKAAITRIGRDPALYSGHSLRAGLATAAEARGTSLGDIQKHTRHSSLDQLAVYLRRVPGDIIAGILEVSDSEAAQDRA